MAQDAFEERKEITQLLIDAHIMYGDKFVKEFHKFIDKKFPLRVTLTTRANKLGQGLRIVEKPEETVKLAEEPA